jgi:hypothetical protein
MRRLVTLRLPAFRFLYFFLYFLPYFFGFGETGVANKETEAPPLSFHVLPGLRASRGRVLQRSGEEARRENDACCPIEATARWSVIFSETRYPGQALSGSCSEHCTFRRVMIFMRRPQSEEASGENC